MIDKPTDLYPYGDTIDASKENDFYFRVNGDKVVSYQVDVFDLSNTKVYTTGKVTNDNQLPAYGGKGNESFIHITIPSSSVSNNNEYKWYPTVWEEVTTTNPNPTNWVTSGRIQLQANAGSTSVRLSPHTNFSLEDSTHWLKINGKFYKITAFTLDTADPPLYGTATISPSLSGKVLVNTPYQIYTDYVRGDVAVFKARSTPTLQLLYNDVSSGTVTLNSNEAEFIGRYTQTENTRVVSYKFDIFLNGESSPIATSGEIFSGDIRFKYNAFVNNTDYRIVLMVIDADKRVSKVERSVSVSYSEANLHIQPIITVDKEHSCITIDSSSLISIVGNASANEDIGYRYITIEDGVYTYEKISPNGIELFDGQSIYWDNKNGLEPLDVPEDFTIVLHENFDDDLLDKFFEFQHDDSNSKYTILYDGCKFYLEVTKYNPFQHFTLQLDPYPSKHHTYLSTNQPDKDTLYYFDFNDSLDTTKYFTWNNIAHNYWWHIVLLPGEFRITKGLPAVTGGN